MRNLVLIALTLGFSASALARQCDENYAKYGALRVYHSETGLVQGSDGPEAVAAQIYSKGDFSKYNVAITDNNEDGDVWEVSYAVTLRQVGDKCQVLKVKGL